MSMGKRYIDPEAAGYLLDAEACGKVVKELRRLAEKFQRRIDREQAAGKAEFDAAMQYNSEQDILDAYGWDVITEKQYELYINIFRQGQAALEQHTPTSNELALQIFFRIIRDIEAEQREWQFSALSPQEQMAERARAEQAKTAWKRKIAEIKERLGMAEADAG